MQVVSYPSARTMLFFSYDSEEQGEQEHKSLVETYEIYSSGDVRRNDEVVRLKDEDLDAIIELYVRFCKQDVSIENYLIPDLGVVLITVYGADQKTYEYEITSNRRCKEVTKVKAIIDPYFEHVLTWRTVNAGE